jgi:hypothetical protein
MVPHLSFFWHLVIYIYKKFPIYFQVYVLEIKGSSASSHSLSVLYSEMQSYLVPLIFQKLEHLIWNILFATVIKEVPILS